MRHNLERFNTKPAFKKTNKVIVALLARIFKVLMAIHKMDDDYFLDFEDDLIEVGRYLSQSERCMHLAIHHGLDVNWLLTPEIPEDITQIHKSLRESGYLK